MMDKLSAAATVMAAENAAVKDLRTTAEKLLEAARAHATSEDLLPAGMSQARAKANELVGLLDSFLNNSLTQAERMLGANPPMPLNLP